MMSAELGGAGSRQDVPLPDESPWPPAEPLVPAQSDALLPAEQQPDVPLPAGGEPADLLLAPAEQETDVPLLPLLPGWEEIVDPSDGAVYYHNSTTGESCWERPQATHANLPQSVQTEVTLPPATEGLPALRGGQPFSVGVRPKVEAFGSKLREYCMCRCYECEVPMVLCAPWVELVRGDMLKTEGLFRLQPDSQRCAAAEKELQRGCLRAGYSPEVYANLIKIFFRKMPNGLIGRIGAQLVDDYQERGEQLLLQLPAAERSVLLWLVRVLQHIARFREYNKMNLRNLTVVFAPNLYALQPSTNPLEDLAILEFVSNALHTLVVSDTLPAKLITQKI